MANKTRILLTFLAGLLVGGWIVFLFGLKLLRPAGADDELSEITASVIVLERLRKGEQAEAIELLEQRLDVTILGASAILGENAERRREPEIQQIVRKVRMYRATFPRTAAQPTVKRAVDQALDQLSVQ